MWRQAWLSRCGKCWSPMRRTPPGRSCSCKQGTGQKNRAGSKDSSAWLLACAELVSEGALCGGSVSTAEVAARQGQRRRQRWQAVQGRALSCGLGARAAPWVDLRHAPEPPLPCPRTSSSLPRDSCASRDESSPIAALRQAAGTTECTRSVVGSAGTLVAAAGFNTANTRVGSTRGSTNSVGETVPLTVAKRHLSPCAGTCAAPHRLPLRLDQLPASA